MAGKLKKKLMSYQEWAEKKEREEGPEKGLEDADFVPAVSPVGLIRKGVKKGIKEALKSGAKKMGRKPMGKKPMVSSPKPGPALNYKKLGKTPNEKANIPNWKRKLIEKQRAKEDIEI